MRPGLQLAANRMCSQQIWIKLFSGAKLAMLDDFMDGAVYLCVVLRFLSCWTSPRSRFYRDSPTPLLVFRIILKALPAFMRPDKSGFARRGIWLAVQDNLYFDFFVWNCENHRFSLGFSDVSGNCREFLHPFAWLVYFVRYIDMQREMSG